MGKRERQDTTPPAGFRCAARPRSSVHRGPPESWTRLRAAARRRGERNFGVVSVLVVADRTRGTGRFNLVQGALATAVGLGAALSTTFGGKLIHQGNYRVSFLALGAAAVLALALLWFAMPETLHGEPSPILTAQEITA